MTAKEKHMSPYHCFNMKSSPSQDKVSRIICCLDRVAQMCASPTYSNAGVCKHVNCSVRTIGMSLLGALSVSLVSASPHLGAELAVAINMFQ